MYCIMDVQLVKSFLLYNSRGIKKKILLLLDRHSISVQLCNRIDELTFIRSLNEFAVPVFTALDRTPLILGCHWTQN